MSKNWLKKVFQNMLVCRTKMAGESQAGLVVRTLPIPGTLAPLTKGKV